MDSKEDAIPAHVLIGILIFGIILIVSSVMGGNSRFTRVNNSNRAQGEVIKVITKQNTVGTNRYHRKIKFNDEKGRSITFVANEGHVWEIPKIGEKVEVSYTKDLKKSPIVISWGSILYPSLLLGGVGLVFTALPTLLFLKSN